MKRSSGLVLGVAFGLAMATLLRAGPESAPAKVPERLARAKVDAARKTYEILWKNYQDELIPVVEVVYRWSRRWLEAELELKGPKADQEAAHLAHLNRMRDLARIARERRRFKINTVEEVSAAEFYCTEAEIWLEQAKMK